MENKHTITARPKVAELCFHLYGRSLHPELFEIHTRKEISRSEYSASINITSTGHVISWQSERMVLSEVTASSQHPLPEQRRLISNTLRGESTDEVICRGDIRFKNHTQLESVDSKVFWAFQKQIGENTTEEGLLHCFDSNGRISLGAISYIHVTARAKQLVVRAFHTFPEDFVILQTQSHFSLP